MILTTVSFLVLAARCQQVAQGFEALYSAVRARNIQEVERILKSGVHPDLTESGIGGSQNTVLFRLCFWASNPTKRASGPSKDEDLASLLIAHGATLYPGNSSIFHRAASLGALGVLRACLKAGSDPNEVFHERRPLCEALGPDLVLQGEYRTREEPERPLMVKELIEAGADVHLPVKGNGSKALHIAAYYAFPQCVNILLDAGADLNEQTFDDGYTPLHCALLKENSQDIQTARILLDRGARLDLEDVYNRTVEQMVRQKRYTAAIELIEEYKKKRSPPRGA